MLTKEVNQPGQTKDGRFVAQNGSAAQFGLDVAADQVPQVADLVQGPARHQPVDALQFRGQDRRREFEIGAAGRRRLGVAEQATLQHLAGRRPLARRHPQAALDHLLQVRMHRLDTFRKSDAQHQFGQYRNSFRMMHINGGGEGQVDLFSKRYGYI